MKLHTLAAACAAFTTLSIAGSALAQLEVPVIAKLQAPVASSAKFISGGSVFICTGDTCVAAVSQSATFTAATCRDVAKHVGPVASFTTSGHEFDSTRLGACNQGIDTQVAKR